MSKYHYLAVRKSVNPLSATYELFIDYTSDKTIPIKLEYNRENHTISNHNELTEYSSQKYQKALGFH